MILTFTTLPTSAESLILGMKQFLKVANALDWKADHDVRRRMEYREGIVLDYWYVTPGREIDALRILMTARKAAKAYASISEGPKYKEIRKDTESILKHISSLIRLLERMDDDWYDLVSQQDGRNWEECSSLIKNKILNNIDSIRTGTTLGRHRRDQWIRDLDTISLKCFHAFMNLNEKTWDSRGNIPEKLLGSADLFLVSKALLLLESFKPLQEGQHKSKAIAEVADAMKALALGGEGSNAYRPIPKGRPIQWPTHHIHIVRTWRKRLQGAMDFLEEVEGLAISDRTASEVKTCLPIIRHQAREALRDLLQGPGHAIRKELLELDPSAVN